MKAIVVGAGPGGLMAKSRVVSLVLATREPMTPNLAQGAGTAIEDAVSLAEALGQTSQVEPALGQQENDSPGPNGAHPEALPGRLSNQ